MNFLIQSLSCLRISNIEFKNIQEKTKNLVETLLFNNQNFFGRLKNIFSDIYTEIIGDIKTKLYELFYNQINFANEIHEDKNINHQIKYSLFFYFF